jgi:hypothetical protein
MNHAYDEQYENAKKQAEWLQSVQNMVGSTITTYLTMMKQMAPKKGDRLIFWLGARTNMVFGMGFDIGVNREGVLQAFVSNTGGTVAQIAAGKVGERLVTAQLTRFLAQRVLVSVGAAALAPEIAIVVGACGVAYGAYQVGNEVNGWIDRTFFSKKKDGGLPQFPATNKPSNGQIQVPSMELHMLARWILTMDTSPYTLPAPLTRQFFGKNSGNHGKRR